MEKWATKNMQLVLQHCCRTSGITMSRVLPAPTSNLSCSKSGCLRGLMWVVKCATSLFNLFCSNVARQVAHFLLPVFLYLKREFFFNNVWYNFCFCSFRTGKGLGYSAHFSGPMLVLESAVKTGKRENKVLHHLVKFEFHPQKVTYKFLS